MFITIELKKLYLAWSEVKYIHYKIYIKFTWGRLLKQLFGNKLFPSGSWIWRTMKTGVLCVCVLWCLGQRKQTACKHKSQKQYIRMTLWTQIRADSPGVTAHSRNLCKAIQDRRAVSSVYSESLQPSPIQTQTWGHLVPGLQLALILFIDFETEPAEYCTQNHRPVSISSPLISRPHHPRSFPGLSIMLSTLCQRWDTLMIWTCWTQKPFRLTWLWAPIHRGFACSCN